MVLPRARVCVPQATLKASLEDQDKTRTDLAAEIKRLHGMYALPALPSLPAHCVLVYLGICLLHARRSE